MTDKISRYASLGPGLLLLAACGVACTSAVANEPLPITGPETVPIACWAAAADGAYDDFDASVALYEGCTADDYSFAVVNPALGEIRCFRGEGFCPLEQPGLSRAAVRLSGFAAGAARGEIGSRHQISNVIVDNDRDDGPLVSFRSTAFYFNQDGSFEIGWGDHQLQLIQEDGAWKIRAEDVFIPAANQRMVATPHAPE